MALGHCGTIRANGGCSGIWRDRLIHISQASIDSISMEVYNMLIRNGQKIRLVKTEEAEKMEHYLE